MSEIDFVSPVGEGEITLKELAEAVYKKKDYRYLYCIIIFYKECDLYFKKSKIEMKGLY